jgi:hypothetical protein
MGCRQLSRWRLRLPEGRYLGDQGDGVEPRYLGSGLLPNLGVGALLREVLHILEIPAR